jgi:hypothetical protein
LANFPASNFHGLGELNEDQLASLFGFRHEVTAAELSTAVAAWSAYRATEPGALEKFLRGDTSALPFIRPAFSCHLTRFPSVSNGLGRIEQRGLALINDGLNKFVDLFPRFGEVEPGFGLGDWQFLEALKRLQEARSPLVSLKNGPTNGEQRTELVRKLAFEITPAGRAVLQGETDFVKLNGIDQWLGGVHLTETNLWRWDEQKQEVVRG